MDLKSAVKLSLSLAVKLVYAKILDNCNAKTLYAKHKSIAYKPLSNKD